MYTLHARFCTLGADLHAQSVLIDKLSASELSRKFIKSALWVGLATVEVQHPTRQPVTVNLLPPWPCLINVLYI